MGISQINQSFQNDGNFSQLDLRDVKRNGVVMRIETFRCSQPDEECGKTAAGTNILALAGKDHLKDTSNRTFRHIFSVGDLEKPKATLEIREIYDQDGSMEVRTRDIDGDSDTFGAIIINTISPKEDGVYVRYEIRKPGNIVNKLLTSPIRLPVSDLIKGFEDISSDLTLLGSPVSINGKDFFDAVLSVGGDNRDTFRKMDLFSSSVREVFSKFSRNIKIYERMGDFRDKCIHPGTNLTGKNIELASEFMLIRAYRMSLITLGRIFDEEMSAGADKLNAGEALALDTKPGVYSVFLSAYSLNIGLYQLGLDKVHSDYGGIPMKLSPGSRLETGSEPLVDSTNLNRMLALLAGLYYAPAAIPQIINIKPSIKDFVKEVPLAPRYFK